jgi:hypothetical protein
MESEQLSRYFRVVQPERLGSILCLLHSVQTTSGAHPVSYSMSTERYFTRGQSGMGVKLITHLHIVRRTVELYLHSFIHLHGVVYFIKNRDNVIVYYKYIFWTTRGRSRPHINRSPFPVSLHYYSVISDCEPSLSKTAIDGTPRVPQVIVILFPSLLGELVLFRR